MKGLRKLASAAAEFRIWSLAVFAAFAVAPGDAQIWPVGSQAWRQGTADGTGTILGAAQTDEYFGAAVATGDFDHDGFADLAVGAPMEDAAGFTNAGTVHVLYGTASRLRAARNQVFTQGIDGVPGTAEDEDRFGNALAVGRFNDDPYDDLAIASVYERIGSLAEAGAVIVLYGGAQGLSSVGAQLWHQDSEGIDEDAEEFDHFGWSLAAGDRDGDGFDDLAVGVPGEAQGGGVQLFSGGAAEMTGENEFLDQNNDLFGAQSAESGDGFGTSVAFGDFSGDGIADLVIGVPFETTGAVQHGAVQVIPYINGPTGPAQYWDQDSSGVEGAAENLDGFGAALAVGDFNGDGADDLAIGAPSEDLGSPDAGAVNVLYGGFVAGLSSAGDQQWTQDSPGVPGAAEESDFFGNALAAGDFDRDGRSELAVGAHWESLGGGLDQTGVVQILIGGASGLTATGSQMWHRDSPGIAETANAFDHFASSLAAGDFDGDGHSDLVAGVPSDPVGGLQAGSVSVLYGALFADGLESAGTSFWSSAVQ